jgi:hypothetical protein
MGNAGRHHAPPYRPLPKPTAPMPPGAGDRTITIPATVGDQTVESTVSWRFATNNGVKVRITNTGNNACEILDAYPDGGGHRLRPGRTAELSVVDGCENLPLRMRSAGGTTLVIAVPHILAKKKTVVRADATQLIEHVVETPVWVPAP